MKYTVDDMYDYFEVENIPGWCAASKLSEISDRHVPNLSHRNLIKFLKEKDREASVFVISVNEKEVKLIEFLTNNKWIPGPWLKNHIHNSRKTCLFFKQISKTAWCNNNGGRPF